MPHYLQINGVDGPLLQQFGCECGRCRAPERQANTSASLITTNNQDQTIHHVLFDVGLGVVDSLIASPLLSGDQARLDAIVLTHWHPDHVAELNRLAVAYTVNRQRRGLSAARIPLYCRSGTAAWLRREQGHLLRAYLELHESGEYEPPGTVLPSLPGMPAELTITPVTVSHFTADRTADDSASCPASAAYSITTADSKVVLLWDIDSENDWLADPQTPAEHAAASHLAEACILAIDTCYWHRKPHRTTHPSLENVVRYVAKLRPQCTLLMHLSGHPDGPGNKGWGWTNEEWTANAKALWAAGGLPGEVLAPGTGQIFALDQSR